MSTCLNPQYIIILLQYTTKHFTSKQRADTFRIGSSNKTLQRYQKLDDLVGENFVPRIAVVVVVRAAEDHDAVRLGLHLLGAHTEIEVLMILGIKRMLSGKACTADTVIDAYGTCLLGDEIGETLGHLADTDTLGDAVA